MRISIGSGNDDGSIPSPPIPIASLNAHVRRCADWPVLARAGRRGRNVQADVQLLTYDEISAAFSINRESARHLVLRKRWARRKGNDGKARVEVPIDALESAH